MISIAISSDMSHLESCKWVPYYSRRQMLTAAALAVRELGIGTKIEQAMDSGAGKIVAKVLFTLYSMVKI